VRRLGVIFFIAWKHLRVRRRQSLVTMLSVGLGAMILVVTMAMMEGLLREFKHKLLESSPPVIVEKKAGAGPRWLDDAEADAGVRRLRRGSPPRERDEIKRYPELEALLQSMPGVAAVAPRACTPVIIFHGTRSYQSLVCGIEADKERKVTRLWRWMREGKMEDLDANSDGIILGHFLARHLAARPGSRVQVIAPGGVASDLKVVGVYASGVTKIDVRQSFVRLSEGRRLAGLGEGVSGVGVNVTALDQAPAVARRITRMTGYEALTWEEANQSAIGAFRMMGVSTYFLVVFTAVVGGFGILNIMITIVMEKQKDIALLGSVGYAPGLILAIFFTEALVLGAAGGVLGCGLGYVGSNLLNLVHLPTSEASMIQRPGLGMYQDPWFYAIAFGISLAISLAAGVGPARRAARVDPVTILRGER
jgi:lipoprotein-releasing system permease protein